MTSCSSPTLNCKTLVFTGAILTLSHNMEQWILLKLFKTKREEKTDFIQTEQKEAVKQVPNQIHKKSLICLKWMDGSPARSHVIFLDLETISASEREHSWETAFLLIQLLQRSQHFLNFSWNINTHLLANFNIIGDKKPIKNQWGFPLQSYGSSSATITISVLWKFSGIGF